MTSIITIQVRPPPYFIIQLQLDNFVPSAGATTTLSYMTTTGTAILISGSRGNIALYDLHQYVTSSGINSVFTNGTRNATIHDL